MNALGIAFTSSKEVMHIMCTLENSISGYDKWNESSRDRKHYMCLETISAFFL